jgi:D-sedoheptulose 7-phosphate isomerase
MSSLAPIRRALEESRNVLDAFIADPGTAETLDRMAIALSDCFARGGKALSCGNGGSACDALHFAEEFTGRFKKDRKALPVIPLLDGANLTCVANDYGFESIFSRGVEAYGRTGDVLLAISTSGNSANVIKAVEAARAAGMVVMLLLGKDGGKLKGKGDHELRVVSPDTERIQEVHMIALHILIESVERRMFPENYQD